jgi:hypothetical protein
MSHLEYKRLILINWQVRGSFRDWGERTAGALRGRRSQLKLNPLGRESTRKGLSKVKITHGISRIY